jgi:hypothetical protein
MVVRSLARWLPGLLLVVGAALPVQAQYTFDPSGPDVNRTFHLDRTVVGPDGQEYRVRGDLHIVLHARERGGDVAIRGHANSEGISVNQLRGPRSYRAVGSTPIEHYVEHPRRRASDLRTSLSYDLISRGGGRDFRLVVHLDGRMTSDYALAVGVSRVDLLPR